MTSSKHPDIQNIYAICVEGTLDPMWSDWFDGFTITYPADNETQLTGKVVDQAALHGLFAALRDLNLPILSVQKAVNPIDHND